MKLFTIILLSAYLLSIDKVVASYHNTWLEGANIKTKNLSENLDYFNKRNKRLGIIIPENLGVLISTGLDLQNSKLSSDIKSLFSKRTKAFGCFIVNNNHPYIVIPETILKMDNDGFYSEYVQHEMVHFDQWKRGDLVFDGLYVQWQDLRKHISEIFDVKGLNREEIIKQQTNFPWEMEAYARHNPFEHSKPDFEKITVKN